VSDDIGLAEKMLGLPGVVVTCQRRSKTARLPPGRVPVNVATLEELVTLAAHQTLNGCSVAQDVSWAVVEFAFDGKQVFGRVCELRSVPLGK
jgi:hypothetical protein